MKEVSRERFQEIYFALGGGAATGWDAEHWRRSFDDERPGMTYLAEEPESPEHTRMMIVTDYERMEHRLFFLTPEGEDSLFEFPAED